MLTEEALKQLLIKSFATLGVHIAGTHGDPHRRSATDLATDLAPLLLSELESRQPVKPLPVSNSLFCIAGAETETCYVLAPSYGEAIEKWRRRMVADSDGAESLLDPALIPDSVARLAPPGAIIR